jgi:ABC-type branched-subunit amino acid transport system ATPase component
VPPAQIAVAGLGRSFQDPQIIDEYTVLENVLCGAHIRLNYGLISQLFRFRMVERLEADMTRRAHTLLEFMGLDTVAHHEAGSLPYGARKLVDIARAMVPGPQLLLLDEPSSGLDAHERKNLETTLITLRNERLVSLLVVEHHMDLVRAVSTQVVGMQAGEVLMTGTPADVLDSELFREAIVGGSHRNDGLVDDEATALSEEDRWSA